MGSNWQYVSIGLDNGLAPSRRQAIILTYSDPFHQRIYAALGGGGGMSKDWIIYLQQNNTQQSINISNWLYSILVLDDCIVIAAEYFIPWQQGICMERPFIVAWYNSISLLCMWSILNSWHLNFRNRRPQDMLGLIPAACTRVRCWSEPFRQISNLISLFVFQNHWYPPGNQSL